MGEFSVLRPSVRVYVGAIVVVGLATLAHSAHQLYLEPLGTQWFVLAALTLLTGSFTVKVPSINAHISVSETFVFASVLLFGPAAGAITVLLECLVINFWIKHGRPLHRVLFNITAPAIAIWLSGRIFFFTSGIEPYSKQSTPLPGLFVPLFVFTVLYFLLNSFLVAVALGLETGRSPFRIWWNNFTWLSVNYFSGASVAALIVTYTRELDVSTLAVIVPLLVVSYLTFRTAMGRVEDTNNHLAELNKLYLSTIETLAMAIDAKDQITHGHIRRVQGYAVGLAKHVGISDERLIKAIEAAALLHDMGKLAVPEYILNKPGKLTAAEFAKMKLHASVGADILSAIDFPYPVVPIVRHHHENWDGSGYPSGLKGTDIPIGARILAVVDCFDALTSDRPYRPRLAADEALRILVERRGTMYDPLVVDTFARVHTSISAESSTGQLPHYLLNEITTSGQHAEPSSDLHGFSDISSSKDEGTALLDLAAELTGKTDLTIAGDVVTKHLRRLIPFAVSVLYVFDERSDELVASHSAGDRDSLTVGLRIARGQRLSGWVAANRMTILNSDATLDFGEVARQFTPPLKSCLSAPIASRDQILGVLTLYSNKVEAFNEDHRRIIESASRQLVNTFRSELEPERIARGGALTSLRNSNQVEQLLQTVFEDDSNRSSRASALLLVEIGDLRALTTDNHAGVTDGIVRQVIACTRAHLRDSDFLFWFGPYQFVAFLAGVSNQAASAIADELGSSIRLNLGHAIDQRLTIRTSVTQVSTSNPLAAIKEVMAKASRDQKHLPSFWSHQIH